MSAGLGNGQPDDLDGSKDVQPWEVALLTLIRDMQWRYTREGEAPELLAPLDGAPEAAGDFVAVHEDRALFVEIKRDLASCSAKREREKPSFKGYKRLLSSLGSNDDAAIYESLWTATRAHFFTYWVDRPDASPREFTPGVVAFRPYMLEVARHMIRSGAPTAALALTTYSLATREGNSWQPREAANFEPVFHGSVNLAKGELSNGVASEMLPVGLGPDEVERFAEELTKMHGKKDEKFACIAVSTSGLWIKAISTLGGILALAVQMRSGELLQRRATSLQAEEGDWAPTSNPSFQEPKKRPKPK